MEGAKGTVTSLASLFPVEEAKRAAKRVEDAIAEKQKELDHIRRFSSDNTNLIKLVKRLPGELFHDVMVPFGKAAFFPGRLIHTNEFLVLLGEGYYAERTSNQTVELLKRREHVLTTQFDSLKAIMSDLKAEASFFDTTASEGEEGLVEIREDYVEELPSERMSNHADFASSNMGSSKDNDMENGGEDEEYAKFMKKLDELERQELMDELESKELGAESDEDVEADFGCSISQRYYEDNDPRGAQKPLQIKSLHNATAEEACSVDKFQQNLSDQSTIVDLRAQHVPKDVSRSIKNSMDPEAVEKPLLYPGFSENIYETSSPKFENSNATLKAGDVSQKVSRSTTTRSSDDFKAFTGSVVEHAHGLQSNTAAGYNSKSSQPGGLNPSKPVSRFKMQKGGS